MSHQRGRRRSCSRQWRCSWRDRSLPGARIAARSRSARSPCSRRRARDGERRCWSRPTGRPPVGQAGTLGHHVAASRSREETYLYATPEIRPSGASTRRSLPTARPSATSPKPPSATGRRGPHTKWPISRRCPPRSWPGGATISGPAARREVNNQREVDALSQRIEKKATFPAGLDAQRTRAQELPRRMRRRELERIDQTEVTTRQILARHEAEARQMPAVEDRARRELAAVDQVLAQRRQVALAAARIAPPGLCRQELRERPIDPQKRRAWERGVEAIEGYRQEHGIKDSRSALGPNPKTARERAARDAARRRLRQAQRDLGMGRSLRRSKERSMGLGIGL